MMGYGLLGATWLVMKTTGELEIWARRKAIAFLVGTIVAMADREPLGAVPRAARSNGAGSPGPTSRFLAPVPLLTAFTAWRIYHALDLGLQYRPVLPIDRACSCSASSGSP